MGVAFLERKNSSRRGGKKGGGREGGEGSPLNSKRKHTRDALLSQEKHPIPKGGGTGNKRSAEKKTPPPEKPPPKRQGKNYSSIGHSHLPRTGVEGGRRETSFYNPPKNEKLPSLCCQRGVHSFIRCEGRGRGPSGRGLNSPSNFSPKKWLFSQGGHKKEVPSPKAGGFVFIVRVKGGHLHEAEREGKGNHLFYLVERGGGNPLFEAAGFSMKEKGLKMG